MAEAALVHGAVQRVVLLKLVLAVLVDDEDAARLELAHVDVVVGPHGGTNDEVVEAVAVQVAGRDGITEVGSDLAMSRWDRTMILLFSCWSFVKILISKVTAEKSVQLSNFNY